MADKKSAIRELLEQHKPDYKTYEDIREDLHRHPELSRQEEKTAAKVVDHLKSLDVYKIHTGVGGHGVVAVLENGPGKVVLLRADMDALPVEEQSDLPYKSEVTMVDEDELKKPVMHACGHDVHVACLLGAASVLAKTKSTGAWSGTAILLFQPSEERASGAQAMVDDGLYSRLGIPEPDILLAQHVTSFRAGFLGINSGTFFSASNSLKVTLYGVGSHGSAPHSGVDPVVLAAHVILRLQEIVSRELKPDGEFGVLTIGYIRAGEAENVIPDKAEIKLNIRTIDTKVRDKILKSIERIVKAECAASRSPKEPKIEHILDFPPTVNDENLVKEISETFGEAFDDFNPKQPRNNASEDFSILALSIKKPCAYWMLGGIEHEVWDKSDGGEGIATNHSPFFSPVTKPTVATGIDAMFVGAMTFLKSKQ